LIPHVARRLSILSRVTIWAIGKSVFIMKEDFVLELNV